MPFWVETFGIFDLWKKAVNQLLFSCNHHLESCSSIHKIKMFYWQTIYIQISPEWKLYIFHRIAFLSPFSTVHVTRFAKLYVDIYDLQVNLLLAKMASSSAPAVAAAVTTAESIATFFCTIGSDKKKDTTQKFSQVFSIFFYCCSKQQQRVLLMIEFWLTTNWLTNCRCKHKI